MANQFGGPAPATSFLVGLASSTMDAFKQDHDRELAEDFHAKQIDHDLLMKALQQVQHDDTLTPSQRTAATQEIMQRSVDIFKPKGHGGIKDNLKSLFGGGERYIPQGVGDLLTKQRPKADVNVSIPEGAASVTGGNVSLPMPPQHRATLEHGAVFDTETPLPAEPDALNGVTLPLPPRAAVDYSIQGGEQSFRELDRTDEAQKQGDILRRQLAVQDARASAKRVENIQRNNLTFERMSKMAGIRADNNALAKLKERTAMISGGDPNDSDAMEIAAEQMKGEIAQKKEDAKAKIALNAERVKGISARISQGWDRVKQGYMALQQGDQKIAIQRWARFQDDPNVKGAQKAIGDAADEARGLHTAAATLRSEFIKWGDDRRLAEAEKLEARADALLDGDGYTNSFGTHVQGIREIEQKAQRYVEERSGAGRTPSSTAGPRPGVTLEGAIQAFKARAHRAPTEAEIANIKKHYGLQ